MKILLTSTLSYPSVGGAQLHWHKISCVLASRGHRVKMITQGIHNHTDWLIGTTLGAPRRRINISPNNVDITQIAPSLGSRALMFPFVLGYHVIPEVCSPALARIFVDQVEEEARTSDMVHNIRIGRDYFSWASLIAARRARVPFFITPNISPRMLTRMGRFVVRQLFKLLRSADGIFAFTDEERQTLIEIGVPNTKIEVIGVGPILSGEVDPEGFKQEFGITGPMVLFLGQKYEYKGYRQLLEAAPIVWKRHPDVHFVFIGPYYGRSRDLLSKAAQDSRIIDFGPDSGKLKASALALCTMFCLPSRQEGFGGVFTEAWSFAKPVIACDVRFVRSVVDDGTNGLLIPQTSESISEAINYLLEHPERAAELGNAGWKKVITKYNWDTICDQVQTFYQRVSAAA